MNLSPIWTRISRLGALSVGRGGVGPAEANLGENEPGMGSWLPDMDLNHDKQIQSLLCYRYTIGQAGKRGPN